MQYNATQYNTTQHNTTQHNTIQHNNTHIRPCSARPPPPAPNRCPPRCHPGWAANGTPALRGGRLHCICLSLSLYIYIYLYTPPRRRKTTRTLRASERFRKTRPHARRLWASNLSLATLQRNVSRTRAPKRAAFGPADGVTQHCETMKGFVKSDTQASGTWQAVLSRPHMRSRETPEAPSPSSD